MNLDLNTLFWILSMIYGANLVLALALQWGHTEFPGSRWWILAQALAALGTYAHAVRDSTPYLVPAIGNGILLAAVVSYLQSVRHLRGKPRKLWMFTLPLALALVFPWLEATSLSLRVVLYNIPYATTNFLVFRQLIRGAQRHRLYPIFLAALPFLAMSIGSLVQTLVVLGQPQVHSFVDFGPGYTLFLLLAILSSPLSLFGYYLLAGVHSQELLEETTDDLRRVNQSLRESQKTKDLFVSVLSHDLMGPISGSARYVRKHLLPPEVDLEAKRRSLSVLAESLEKTHRFLENLLWWSRAQREDWGRRRRPLDLAQVAQEALSVIRPAFESKGVLLESQLEPLNIRGDKDSLQLVVGNLLSNALKFSPAGETVEVETTLTPQGDPVLRITDHGVGIDPELRQRLFQIQHKVTTPGTSGETGNGMGLILSWEFVKLNGGTLILTSEPGLGTTVILRFPPEAPSHATQPLP